VQNVQIEIYPTNRKSHLFGIREKRSTA